MWFEMWSNNTATFFEFTFYYTALFQSFRFWLTVILTTLTGDQQRTRQNIKSVYCNGGFCLVMTMGDEKHFLNGDIFDA